MKFSINWLKEWVDTQTALDDFLHRLTMAGLEVESVHPVALAFTGVVVAELVDVNKHPNADRLNVCTVRVSDKETRSVVCGARNVYVGMKSALAQIGAVLPGGITIKRAQLRGVESEGMLCAAEELGLEGPPGQGILDLPTNAPLGVNIRDYLNLDDQVVELSITPNRGDCLSIAGLAREVGAIFEVPVTEVASSAKAPMISDALSVTIQTKQACPYYVGRIIKNINTHVKTPLWMQERLRRGGVKSIHPVVDVTNYVMLELGQPLHAFDLSKLSGGITVREAKADESLTLLDGQTISLEVGSLLIADEAAPLALAGVMGGLESAVDLNTHHLFLESAYFDAQAIGARQYNIQSESSYRFERGVAPGLQTKAIERATELLLSIVGGEAGPLTEAGQAPTTPIKSIDLRYARIARMLGDSLPEGFIANALKRLGMHVKPVETGLNVKVPNHRFDVSLEVDLIEEVARLYGYDRLAVRRPCAPLKAQLPSEKTIGLSRIRHLLTDEGFYEVISYSFIDKQLQHLINPGVKYLELANPIASDLSVMRTHLLPGLIKAMQENRHRQHEYIRLFESGMCFSYENETLVQHMRLGGLISSDAYPEQWGLKKRPFDFYDLKGLIERLYALTGKTIHFETSKALPFALHPGQAAVVRVENKPIGYFGAVHPAILQALKISLPVFFFELDYYLFNNRLLNQFESFSKYPSVRRDLALLVDKDLCVEKIIKKIQNNAVQLLHTVKIFDIYQGEHIDLGKKSVALGLIFQSKSRTLIDSEINELMDRVIRVLKTDLNAVVRG